ncbi:MAG: Uncharacterized metal-dependent hydrolase YcfH, partial [uncultured Sphingomonadaceae bacterium]
YPGLVEDQKGVISRARAAGVSAMLNITTRESEWDAILAAAEVHDDVWATVGVHPHDADAHAHVTTDALLARTAHPRVVGLGETGLDYHYDKSDRARQRDNFRVHIAAARDGGVPIVVHTRDAEDDTAAILREELGKGAFAGVVHCFTGTADFARIALDLGFHISFSGIVTFKNARDLQDVARSVPLDRLLIETDSPFLAPVPHRGRPCEPAFVAETAAFLADLRGEPRDALARATSDNFYALFAKARP